MKKDVGCGTVIGIVILFALAVAFLKTFWWLLIGIGVAMVVYQRIKRPKDLGQNDKEKKEYSQSCPTCGAKCIIKDTTSLIECEYCGSTFPANEGILKILKEEEIKEQEKKSVKELNLIPIAAIFLVLGVVGLFLKVTGFGDSTDNNTTSTGTGQTQVTSAPIHKATPTPEITITDSTDSDIVKEDVSSESSTVATDTKKNNKEISLQDFYNDFCANGSIENIEDIADKYGLYTGSYKESSKSKSYKIAYYQGTAEINDEKDLNSEGNYILVSFNPIDDSIYSVSFHTDSFDESNKKDHYDLTKGGRGDSYVSREEPNYIGVIGYAAIYVDQAIEIEKTDNFQDMNLWKIPTYEPDKQFWNETDVKIPHKTEVVVRDQILEHEGYGNYSGYLLVEKTDDGSQYYINVSNFVTKPYWTYQSALRTAAIEGDLIAEYHQSSDYYPVDSGGDKLEIPEGTVVLITGVSGMSKDINEDETGITAIVWKEWLKGYGGVECHFNAKDLQIIY